MQYASSTTDLHSGSVTQSGLTLGLHRDGLITATTNKFIINTITWQIIFLDGPLLQLRQRQDNGIQCQEAKAIRIAYVCGSYYVYAIPLKKCFQIIYKMERCPCCRDKAATLSRA